MKKCILLGMLYVWMLAHTSAQRVQEWGLIMGVSQYQGDLALRHIEWAETQGAGGVFYRRHLNGAWQWRAHLLRGVISGDDRHAPARAFRQYRFKATWVESGTQMEWQWRKCKSWYYVGIFRPRWTPYFFAGVAATRVWGSAEHYGTDHREGRTILDGEPKQSWFFALPYGAGIRWDCLPGWSLGWELGQRPVFSDHLDGISRNANPRRRDWYLVSGITLSYMIGQRSYRDINDR